jgi:hypothetical protein
MAEAETAEAITTSSDLATRTRAHMNDEHAHLPEDVNWRVIVQTNKKFTLHHLHLLSSQTGMTAMCILKKEYQGTKPAHHWYHTRPQIEEATISPVSSLQPLH